VARRDMGDTTEKNAEPRSTRRKRLGRRRLRLAWALVFLAAVVYLYYKPIMSYNATKRELATRRAEVQALRRTQEDLRLRLADSTSPAAREREARRLGYVKPGEQLFVVKGIPAWRKAHSTKRSAHP
jgi:cell division protein FtsB